ncbi:hypothetical protein [Pseudactinotalea sp. HY158]|uniref:hypothetical protein n=1 Tax=Pseudactinotalea sp. HY158 TaxID=2654547 RepID=UPI00129C4D22|nr:hypothetical protein [Pseudactinotalea sp. HY158]QGH69399.1 hypothetical protein GCE65_07625 [Pseudactinotalea sp. HY158]
MTLLLRNGTIHSVGDPFATAVLIDRGTIAWIGQESTADTLAAETVVDLDGLLLTPAFADAWAPAGEGAVPPGVVAAQVAAPATLAAPGLEVTEIAAVHVREAGALGAALERASAGPVAGGPPRLHLPGSLTLTDGDVEAIVRAHAVVVTAAADGGFALPLARLVAEGVLVAFGSGGRDWHDPWSTITAAVSTGPAPLTARAAFNAHSRQVWRLGPPAAIPRGTIAVGSPASVAGWAVEALAVQTPDERVASWSTDPRAGTPLLPALGPGEVRPVHAFTLAGGEVVAWDESILPRPA